MVKFTASESTLVDSRGWQVRVARGGGTRSWYLMVTEFEFRKVKNSGER